MGWNRLELAAIEWDRWIPVSMQFPMKGQDVLVLFRDGSVWRSESFGGSMRDSLITHSCPFHQPTINSV